MSTVDVLVLDDWGLCTFTNSQVLDLMEIVEERSERRSNIVVSQLPLEYWQAALPDPTLADAILDRLVHNAYKFPLRAEESMRKITATQNQNDQGLH